MTQSESLAIMKTGASVFLTGEPGAGKTHTVNEYVSYLRYTGIDVAITASTGIAATHIGGMTIHSWSGIGIKTVMDKRELDALAKNKQVGARVRKAKVLIIDEISMLSALTLSLVDAVCRRMKKNPLPFGGMQVILVGDFFQLPPITKNEQGFGAQSASPSENVGRFSCDASAWKQLKPNICYLTEQHRQDDRDYLGVLSAIRKNMVCSNHLATLQKRKIEQSGAPSGVPKLYTHNIDVDTVNSEILSKLPSKERTFSMSSDGYERIVSALQKTCLSPEQLRLKVGAAVMFTKNNQKEGFVNGTLGTVEEFDAHTGYPRVRTRGGRIIDTEPMDWIVEENGETRAKITQIPLRLAWALTVHKSQGLSLDAAVMDLKGVFEFGQGYVALSRVRRLDGLYLLGWNERAFRVHPDVLAQDSDFRAQSERAVQDLARKNSADLENLTNRFVLMCGGRAGSVQEMKKNPTEKIDGFAKIREKHTNAYRAWDEEQDAELKELFLGGVAIKDLAKEFSRTPGSIRSRLVKNNLIERT